MAPNIWTALSEERVSELNAFVKSIELALELALLSPLSCHIQNPYLPYLSPLSCDIQNPYLSDGSIPDLTIEMSETQFVGWLYSGLTPL